MFTDIRSASPLFLHGLTRSYAAFGPGASHSCRRSKPELVDTIQQT
jgi:hypothetical protein